MTALLACSLLLALAAPGDAVAVDVEVVDPAGKPVGGVAVALATEGGAPLSEFRARMARPNPEARVLASGRTDRAGRAHLAAALGPTERPHPWESYAAWAYGPGVGLAARAIPVQWPADGPTVRLVLRPEGGARVRLVDAAGEPVAGARVAPRLVRGSLVPQAWADELAATTDAAGRAAFPLVRDADLDEVAALAPGLGLQRLAHPFGQETLALAAAGRVEGRVVAADPDAARGCALTLRSGAAPGPVGVAEADADAEGRFAVPSLAEGALRLTITPRAGVAFLPGPGDPPAVAAGRTTSWTVDLKPAARLRGVVRDRDGNAPIADAGIRLDWRAGAPLAWTDAEGRYTAFALAGSVSPYSQVAPPPFYFPEFFLTTVPIPAGLAEFELKPLLLARGGTLVGRVVDADGRPVAGAEVDGYWAMPSRGYDPVRAISGRDGSFRAEGVKPDAEFRLSARGGDAATPGEVSGTGKEPWTLTVRPENAVALDGRVTDDAGAPIRGARVRLAFRLLGPEAMEVENRAVDFAGLDDLRTDADGRFRTPRQLRSNLEYRAEAEAPGRHPARSPWVEPAKGGRTFPDLDLPAIEPTHGVAGRVVDREGRPMAGLLVEQSGDGPRRTAAATDAEGRFRVVGLAPGPAFLFVSGPGVPFAGHRVEGGDAPVEIRARRDGEPVEVPLKRLGSPIDRDGGKALARKLMDEEIRRFSTSLIPRDSDYDLLGVGPWVDPALALDLADRKIVLDADTRNYLRMNAAEALIADDPDEARAVAEAIPAPAMASQIHCHLADAAPDRAAKLEALGAALLHARAEPDPTKRLDEFGRIALRLLALGETARATALLGEGKTLAYSLPAPGDKGKADDGAHARGRFAAKLARVDADAAFDLARGYNPAVYQNWYAGGVALGLAVRNPAGSERALGLMPEQNQRQRRTVRVVGRMAPADPARARRLADALDTPTLRLQALAAMARGLAPTDPAAASKLVDEVLDAFLATFREGSEVHDVYGGTANQAVLLLPIAAQLDPARLERAFWLVAALRPPRPAGSDAVSVTRGLADARIAASLARYDRAVARQILAPIVQQPKTLEPINRGRSAHHAFYAAAAIDPNWAVSLVEQLPEDPPSAATGPKALARRAVAAVLTRGVTDPDYIERWVFYEQGDDPDDER